MKRLPIVLLILVLSISAIRAYGYSYETGRKRTEKPACHTVEEPVRNLIYMIGDGMGLAHVSMLKIENAYEPTSFDRAQNLALITTYSANNRVTDSAAAGTALAGAKKTDNNMLGVTPDGTPVESIITKSVREGRSAGIVVTCALQHATPAAFYAHAASRKDDGKISSYLAGSGLTIVFGGGRDALEQTGKNGETYMSAIEKAGYNIVDNIEDIDVVASPVVGVFADGHMKPMQEGRGEYLSVAVERALEILSEDVARREAKGFILMVEGSQIDMEAHANDAEGVLAEMKDFDAAIARAMDFADRHPGTLVVVTADHETGGLSILSRDTDLSKPDSGIEYDFGTKSHSGTLVPVYLYGAGAERINGIMDNTELSRRMMHLLGME